MVAWLVAAGLAFGVSEEAKAAVGEWVANPVLAGNTTLTEWAAFVKRRTPAVEVPATAETWAHQASVVRNRFLDEVVYRGTPNQWRDTAPRVEWAGEVRRGKGYRIRKLRYEAVPGLWVPALLYEPDNLTGKVPAVLNVNGHVGPPGKAIEEDQIRSINLVKRGIVSLHPEWLSFGELNHKDLAHNNLAYLDVCGVSGLSVFYRAMQGGLDVLAAHPSVDTNRIAMTGLSGGGWQTILLSSLDTRVALAAPNAGYASVITRTEYPPDIGDLEQVPTDFLRVGDYTHLTALLAPRPALLIYNDKDECCFRADHMKPSVYDPAFPVYALHGRTDAFEFYVNSDPGTHNYGKDNREQFYRFVIKHFGLGGDAAELPTDGEILKPEELNVGIPDNNATFGSLADELAKSLPTNPAPTKGYRAWRRDALDRLKSVLRYESVKGTATLESAEERAGLRARRYRFEAGEWSLPLVVIDVLQVKPAGTTILLADEGKATLGEMAAAHLANGERVILMDVLFTGECLPNKDALWQHVMMVHATGARVLGLQAAQIAAVAAFAGEELTARKVGVHAKGWNTAVAALAFAALHRQDLARLTTEDAPESFRQLIGQRADYKKCPALFCFGLLREFEVSDLAALCSGREAR